VIQPLDVLPPIRCRHAIFARFAVFAFNVFVLLRVCAPTAPECGRCCAAW
jgi:hypothetical protein